MFPTIVKLLGGLPAISSRSKCLTLSNAGRYPAQPRPVDRSVVHFVITKWNRFSWPDYDIRLFLVGAIGQLWLSPGELLPARP